jgi:hypothetical protein
MDCHAGPDLVSGSGSSSVLDTFLRMTVFLAACLSGMEDVTLCTTMNHTYKKVVSLCSIVQAEDTNNTNRTLEMIFIVDLFRCYYLLVHVLHLSVYHHFQSLHPIPRN